MSALGPLARPDGPDTSVVAGGVVSTVQVSASTGPGDPPLGVNVSSKRCSPSVRPVSTTGDVQGANGALSSRHWKLPAPAPAGGSNPIVAPVSRVSRSVRR